MFLSDHVFSEDKILLVRVVSAWISSTSKFLSKLGIALHHPHKNLRISRKQAFAYLQVSYDDVKTYSHEITQLLDALESNFHNCYKVEESGCLPFHNSKKFDIEKESQSRSYSANNGVNNFLLNAEVSSYIRKGENIDEISDLLLLKKHWDQLRVQIKVLFFQLNVASEALSIVKSDNCKSFLERREAKDQSYNYPSFQYLPLVDYFLLLKMESSTNCSNKDASQKSSSNMESLQNEQDSCTSKKEDDQLCESKPSTSLAKNPCEKKKNSSSPFMIPSKKSSSSNSDIYEWDKIHRIVERFSENTTTLLSWIDELKDINLYPISSSHQFYYSEEERRATATEHIDRLYVEVIDDAATLLRDLPSEKSTLLTILENVEKQCRRSGIVVGDDFLELSSIKPSLKKTEPKSDYLSSKLRDSLLMGLLVDDSKLPPLRTSSTKCKSDFTPASASTPITTNDKAVSLCDSGFDSDWQPLRRLNTIGKTGRRSRFIDCDYSLKWRYDDFLTEHEALCEWLEKIEVLVGETEMSSSPSIEKEMQFSSYLRQFNDHKAKKDRLSTKADNIVCIYPELRESVQSMMKDLNDLWKNLYEQLIYYLPYSLYDPVPTECIKDYDYMLACPERWFDSPNCFDSNYYWRKKYLRPRYDPFLSLRDVYDVYDEFGDLRPCYDPFLSLRDVYDCYDEFEFPTWKVDCKPKSSPYKKWSSTCDESRISTCEPSTSYETFPKSEWSSERLDFEGIESEIDRNFIRNLPLESYQNSSRFKEDANKKRPVFVSRDKPSETSTNKYRLSLTDSDLSDSEPLLQVEIKMNPTELSAYIMQFHHWLKSIENGIFPVSSSPSIGWDPIKVQELLQKNEDRKVKLKGENNKLQQIMTASEKVMESHDEDVSEFFVLWSSLMLQQRYLNLILFTIDMECVLERRAEVISKDEMERGLSNCYFFDEIWSDCGVDLRPTVQTKDKDYEIFWLFGKNRS